MPLVAAVLLGCATPNPPWSIQRENILETYRQRAAQRQVVVVDIDGTLMAGEPCQSVALFFGLGYRGAEAFKGAPDALRRLGERWDVVILTARDDSLEARTIRWLAELGIPELPVIHSRRSLPEDEDKVAFKAAAIAELSARGLRPAWGIGDKASDLLAYRNNGLAAALIFDGPRDGDFIECVEALGAAPLAIGEPSALTPAVLFYFSQDDAWSAIAERLAR